MFTLSNFRLINNILNSIDKKSKDYDKTTKSMYKANVFKSKFNDVLCSLRSFMNIQIDIQRLFEVKYYKSNGPMELGEKTPLLGNVRRPKNHNISSFCIGPIDALLLILVLGFIIVIYVVFKESEFLLLLINYFNILFF